MNIDNRVKSGQLAFSRREILAGLGSLGISCFSGGALAADDRKARLRLGAISDVHIRCLPGRADAFRQALLYFRDCGVDGVVIAGDIADSGRVAELKLCADTWFSVFPNDKAPDGRHVERLFVLGNHCVDGWSWAKKNPHYRNPLPDEKSRLADSIGYGDVRQRAWRELFHEDFQPVWMKTVKGYPVIGAHWETHGAGIPIEAFMKAHAGEIDPRLPFFYIQHEHPQDTVFGPWAWGHDDGRSTRALSAFPNAIAFSGHSHYPLTDERSIWQGGFTSLNTASLMDVSCDYALRENACGNRFGYVGEQRPRRQPHCVRKPFAQGMVVSVYDDCIAIERHDFVANDSLGEDWVLPLPLGREKPYDFASRRARRMAPEFAADAQVTVARREDAKHGEVCDVTFPCALTKAGCRVFEYEVTATLIADEMELVQAQRRVLASDFQHPDRPQFRKSNLCVFALADLPLKGTYRFSVRPIECFGKKGASIASDRIAIAENS